MSSFMSLNEEVVEMGVKLSSSKPRFRGSLGEESVDLVGEMDDITVWRLRCTTWGFGGGVESFKSLNWSIMVLLLVLLMELSLVDPILFVDNGAGLSFADWGWGGPNDDAELFWLDKSDSFLKFFRFRVLDCNNSWSNESPGPGGWAGTEDEL